MNEENMTIKPVWEQLETAVKVAESMTTEKKSSGEDLTHEENQMVFQKIREFSQALEVLERQQEEASLEQRVAVTAFMEIAEFATGAILEMTEGRHTSTMALLRPMQELALTVWWAIKQDKIIEWYEYSIRNDLEDLKSLESIVRKEGLRANWTNADLEQRTEETMEEWRNQTKELNSRLDNLGNRKSGKEWKDLRKYWRPGAKELAERMRELGDEIPFDDIHISNCITLNGYIHARSRECSRPLKLDSVKTQLMMTMVYLIYAGKEFVERVHKNAIQQVRDHQTGPSRGKTGIRILPGSPVPRLPL